MLNPTWIFVAAVYALAVWAGRRAAIDLPKKVALFFYALVLVFLFQPMTQSYVDLPVDVLRTLPPWSSFTHDHTTVNGQLNDIVLQIAPWAEQTRRAWKSLIPPIWNEAAACGYPLLANGQSSVFSPFRLLALPLDLGHAMTAEAALKLLVALTFMYLWCRRRYSELASVIGAVAFGFSMFLVVWLHFPLITTACFIPAVFFLLDLLIERPTFGRVVAAAAVWAFMLFGGHPETVAHTFFIATLYALWVIGVEREGGWKRFLPLGAALLIAGLIAAPFLLPFGEALKRSKRYQELLPASNSSGAPSADLQSSVLLVQPRFTTDEPRDLSAEGITGFAGFLGVAGWGALLVHVIRRRRWRSREMFFVLATLLVVGIIQSWPGVSDVFFSLFRLAANARLRLFLGLFVAVQAAALVDLFDRDRAAAYAGMAAGSSVLVALVVMARLDSPARYDIALLGVMPSAIVLAVAALAAALPWRDAARMALLAAVVIELWSASHTWNPVLPSAWLYPRTPLLDALDRLKGEAKEPFRIVGDGPMLFPNLAAIYGYEDVRAHDPMVNGRYVGLLRLTTQYDSGNYFATWSNLETRLVDYLNVRYVLTPPGNGVPPRYRLLYDGKDGRIFENPDVLPRFFAVRNVILESRDREFLEKLMSHQDWAHTAYIEQLPAEEGRLRDDFLAPRPADAPTATAAIVSAAPTRYEVRVRAPRYSLVVSSIPWWPGWKVQRNGVRIEPVRVNGAFLGFVVPPGEVDVRVWYDPWTFRFGAIVSAATIAALISAAAYQRRAA